MTRPTPKQADRVTISQTRRATPRSPLVRAVAPVLGGIVVLALIGGLLWVFAAFISRDGGATSERLAPSRLRVASAQTASNLVVEEGPIIFPGLGTTTGERTIVLDHTGDDPETNWAVYYAYPAGGDPSCAVEQIIGTREFIDCDGDTLDVTELAPPPPGVNPIVENSMLSIDLTGVTE